MNKSKFFIAFSIPFIALFTLLLMFKETSATATTPDPISNNNIPLSTLNKVSNGEYSQLQSMVPGVVLVGLKPDVTLNMEQLNMQPNNNSLSTVFSEIGVQNIDPVFASTTGRLFSASNNTEIELNRIYRLHLSSDVNVMQAIQELSANPLVAYAEPDYIAHIITAPNDPLYPGQWGLTQIDAPTAWNVITGTSDVSIAVIDSGLDVDHPDLASQLWVNPGEIAGNGVDDDNNGYIDDIHGWNLVNNNDDLNDNTGHGTQVAGVIAATTNNSAGVAGMCWNCRLMVVKVTQPSGVANYSDIAAGVVYAAQKGAEVINLSLGGDSDSATLRAAIENASQTAVVIGGAGNDNNSTPFYPAAYDDYVLAVAGTTISDTKVGTSNYGAWIDVTAPGEAITTTFDGGGYGTASGTSVAAPFASGLAGLLRSQHPDWSANLVRAQIIHTAENINSLNPSYEDALGSGRINAEQAVTVVAQPLLTYKNHTVDGEMDGRPDPGSTVDLDMILLNEWADATNVQAMLSTSDPYVTMINATASYGNIAAYANGTNGMSFRFSVPGSAPFAYDIFFVLSVTADGGYTVNIPLTISTSPGITFIHGTINTQTWTNDQTYIVDNDAGIAVGETLTIQPGTVVQFDGLYSFSIAGTLVADGTESQPIKFTSSQSNPIAGDWEMISFLDSSVDATFDIEGNYVDGSILRYAVIEYGRGVIIDRANPFISHNTFEHLSGVGANSEGFMASNTNSIIVADNTFLGISMSIWNGPGTGTASIIRNDISDVPEDNPGGAGIYAGGQITITANRVENCQAGLWLTGGSGGFVHSNLLINNDDYGMQIEGYPTVISNTVMFNGGTGIYIRENSLPVLYHNNLVTHPGQFALLNATTNTFDAASNWWGTTNEATIQAAIYDGNDEFGLGVVDYSDYLAGPEQDAPAYLINATLNPASPVGIQTVTFNLSFSRPMEQRINPTVSFGATEPYTTYQVVENAQWLDASHWRATYDVTSLISRGTYTISVSEAMGTDGMEMPTDTQSTFTVDYAGEITDQTPPSAPWVIAGGKENDVSTVIAMWLASDSDSSITGYRYAIGSAAGATDIVNWTDTSNNFVTKSGLGLVAGQQYWLAVQARNEGGLWSTSGYSMFVAGKPFNKVFLPLVIRNQ